MNRNALLALFAALLLTVLLATAPASAQSTVVDFDTNHAAVMGVAGAPHAPQLQDALPTDVIAAAVEASAADTTPTADSLDAITLSTNKGCDASFGVGELMRASWSVTDGDYYRLAVVTDQGTSLPLGNVWTRYSVGRTYYVDAQIAAGPQVRTLRLEGYYTRAEQSCVYNVGAPGEPPSEPPPSDPPPSNPPPSDPPSEPELPSAAKQLVRIHYKVSEIDFCLGRTNYQNLTGSDRLTMTACDDGAETQDWLVEVLNEDDNLVRITSVVDGKCLTLSADGARIRACDGRDSQTMTTASVFDNYYHVRASDGTYPQVSYTSRTRTASLYMCNRDRCDPPHHWLIDIY